MINFDHVFYNFAMALAQNVQCERQKSYVEWGCQALHSHSDSKYPWVPQLLKFDSLVKMEAKDLLKIQNSDPLCRLFVID